MNALTAAAPFFALVALVGCSAQEEFPIPKDWTTTEGSYCVPSEDSARRTGSNEAMMTYTCRISDSKLPDLQLVDFTERWDCGSRRLIERSASFFYKDKKSQPPLTSPMDRPVLPNSNMERLMEFACSRPVR